ncbi:MAG: AraC family transcriptional regulator [Bacteroidia bacterium]|nr:AraC family transcriptional regulator [Bacteroidia bacterium]
MDNPIQFTFLAVVMWIGVYQGLILAPVLWFKKEGNKVTNRLLAGFLAMFALRLLFTIFQFSSKAVYSNIWLAYSLPLSTFYGPLYYLYLKSYIERSFRLKGKQWFHFLPFVIFVLVASTVLIFFTPDGTSYLDMIRGGEVKRIVLIAPLFVAIQTLTYMGMGLRLILKYRRFIKAEASFSENKHIRWLVSLDFLLLIPALSILAIFFMRPPPGDGSIMYFQAVGVFVMLTVIGIVALARPEFLQGLPEILRVEKEEDLLPSPYETSSLSVEKKNLYHKQLTSYLISDKIYLEQDLTLSELSSRLKINTRYLSQVINELEDSSFIDFINKLRIERAKEMLRHPAYQYYTIVAIANEVGFKSKSAFYNAFKKFTHMTPSAFKAGKVQENV